MKPVSSPDKKEWFTHKTSLQSGNIPIVEIPTPLDTSQIPSPSPTHVDNNSNRLKHKKSSLNNISSEVEICPIVKQTDSRISLCNCHAE